MVYYIYFSGLFGHFNNSTNHRHTQIIISSLWKFSCFSFGSFELHLCLFRVISISHLFLHCLFSLFLIIFEVFQLPTVFACLIASNHEFHHLFAAFDVKSFLIFKFLQGFAYFKVDNLPMHCPCSDKLILLQFIQATFQKQSIPDKTSFRILLLTRNIWKFLDHKISKKAPLLLFAIPMENDILTEQLLLSLHPCLTSASNAFPCSQQILDQNCKFFDGCKRLSSQWV